LNSILDRYIEEKLADMILPFKSFYFIRHGQTDWNKEHLYMGSQDIPLNQNGRDQAHIAAGILAGEGINYIITSPLARSLETAQIISQVGDIEIIKLDELKESCLGEAEGKPHNNGSVIREWMGGKYIEGAESPRDFRSRVLLAMQKILSSYKNPLIVSHGGVYSEVSQILNKPIIYLEHCKPIFHNPPLQSDHPWDVIYL
jgi:broad specificity phosphatase PhoE